MSESIIMTKEYIHMKKRISCLLLSLVMLVSLLPLGAVTASAASEHTYSEDIVSLVKEFEGFSATAYWDVSQWSIGYGTVSTKGATITEAKAEEALRAELSKIDTKLNAFASKYSLNFSQEEHDALLSLSYNCGSEWMNSNGRLRSVVVNGGTESEVLFAFSLWANISSVPDKGLLNRRMAEANLYLNGYYSKYRPSSYSYVILNANGGTPGSNGEDKMQGFNVNEGTSILAKDPSKSGYIFGGWFTRANGGTGVTTLDSSVAEDTLYAQYGKKVTVNSSYVNVRSEASASSTQLNTLYEGDSVIIVETKKVNDVMWGRYSDGWIDLEYTNYSGGSINQSTVDGEVIATGTVVCTNSVNVRSGAGTNHNVVGFLKNGAKIDIYEITSVGNEKWGHISTGWVCLTYVNLDSDPSNGNSIWDDDDSDDNDDSDYTMGTVTGSVVNVRKAAGVGSAAVGSVKKGDRIKIYEQTTVGSTPWGRTDKGWVCMNYVKLDAEKPEEDDDDSDDDVIASGTTTANLNVRTGAGTNYPATRYLVSGTRVNIYEKKTVSGQTWGRIGETGWVCLTYVKLDSGENSGSTDTVLDSGTVTVSNLNVRTGPGTGYARVRYLYDGDSVDIYEKKTVNGQVWGRIDASNWICLAYVKLDSGSSSDDGAYWVNTTKLNIRGAAGTGSAIVGSYSYGTNVTVLETKLVGSISWGRTAKGWVCMTYLTSGTYSAGTGVNWD